MKVVIGYDDVVKAISTVISEDFKRPVVLVEQAGEEWFIELGAQEKSKRGRKGKEEQAVQAVQIEGGSSEEDDKFKCKKK